MVNELKYWRDLPKEEKHSIMEKHNVTVMTFELINKIYNEKSLIPAKM